MARAIIPQPRPTHGQSGKRRSAEYRAWSNMITRCENPKVPCFKNYGGRGISVWPEWRWSFTAFFEAIGPKPTPRHTLDRIDNDRNYEPGNMRWATVSEQCRNKRITQRITAYGRTQTITEWCREVGLRRTTFSQRLVKGWAPELALSTPLLRNRAPRTRSPMP